MKVNEELKEYIEKEIYPQYEKNDKGHGMEHIEYVIKRSFKFAKEVPHINLDMVYTIAAYHDIGHSIDAKNHEKVSAKILVEDGRLRDFFSEEEIRIMKEAVEDHRSSLEGEPRSIYGKIVATADKNTDLIQPFKRTYQYRLLHSKGASIEEIMEESYYHLVDKFGKEGYATEKYYFEDGEYQQFLKDLNDILKDKNKFNEMFIKINGLENMKEKK